MSTPVETVAEFIVQESERISNLKLQKLLYYVQGWHLALKRRPLFDDAIEAWVHGPVVPLIFQMYKGYGWREIAKPSLRVSLPAVEETHIRKVLQAYGKYSGDTLKWMTHNESPWKDARGDLPDNALSSRPIPIDSMRVFFERKSRQA